MPRLLSLLALTSLTFVATAQDAPKTPAKKGPNPVYAPVKDDPRLPRVLLVGDSISIGYTLPVRDMLKGVANVHRVPTNCGPTSRGVESIQDWLGEGKWDVIHFNFGLHDLVYMDAKGTRVAPDQGKPQVAIDDYKKNLETIVAAMKKTGAKLIFATTTPVPKGEPIRVPDSDKEYNAAALEVMAKHGVQVNDLNALVRGRNLDGQRPANVHFTDEGSKALAEQVSATIKKALGK